MEALVCDLLDDVKAGKILYVHCLGGHGRAGIVVCLLLAVLYGIPVSEAFKRIQAYHDCRIEPQGVKSPTTVVQRSQVRRLLEKWKNARDEPAGETVPDQQASTVKEPEPQLVVAKNGARGFIVPPERAPSSLQLEKNEKSDATLSRNRSRGSLAKQQPPCLQMASQAKSLQLCQVGRNSNSTSRREISLHRPSSAARLCAGKAAGTGTAAVHMIRKSSAAKLAMVA